MGGVGVRCGGRRRRKKRAEHVVSDSYLNVILRTVLPPMLPMVSPRPLEVRRSNTMLLLPSFTQKESSETLGV